MYKLALIIFFTTICCIDYSSAQVSSNVLSEKNKGFFYAYIRIESRKFSTKLKVNVDLGDSELELKEGERISKILTDKKSYAAILNYMSDIGYELVNTLDLTRSTGTIAVVYVMKKAR